MKWIKQDGREIETNDLPATINAAEKAGWKRAEQTKPKKRGRPCRKQQES